MLKLHMQEDPKPSAKGGGAYFLLQMHDELIYEAAVRDVIRVAKIVRESMENSGLNSIEFQQDFQQSTGCSVRLNAPLKILFNSLLKFN